MIAQEPEVVPDCLLPFDTDSIILNLEIELFLQCPHVNSASVDQPALMVVQLMSHRARTLVLRAMCNLNPSSFGLYPVLELLDVICNFGSACREPVGAPINTEASRTITRTSLDPCHRVVLRGSPPALAGHRRLSESRASQQIRPILRACEPARRNSAGKCPHEILELHHARPDSSVFPSGSRRHSAVPLFQERERERNLHSCHPSVILPRRDCLRSYRLGLPVAGDECGPGNPGRLPVVEAQRARVTPRTSSKPVSNSSWATRWAAQTSTKAFRARHRYAPGSPGHER